MFVNIVFQVGLDGEFEEAEALSPEEFSFWHFSKGLLSDK